MTTNLCFLNVAHITDALHAALRTYRAAAPSQRRAAAHVVVSEAIEVLLDAITKDCDLTQLAPFGSDRFLLDHEDGPGWWRAPWRWVPTSIQAMLQTVLRHLPTDDLLPLYAELVIAPFLHRQWQLEGVMLRGEPLTTLDFTHTVEYEILIQALVAVYGPDIMFTPFALPQAVVGFDVTQPPPSAPSSSPHHDHAEGMSNGGDADSTSPHRSLMLWAHEQNEALVGHNTAVTHALLYLLTTAHIDAEPVPPHITHRGLEIWFRFYFPIMMRHPQLVSARGGDGAAASVASSRRGSLASVSTSLRTDHSAATTPSATPRASTTQLPSSDHRAATGLVSPNRSLHAKSLAESPRGTDKRPRVSSRLWIRAALDYIRLMTETLQLVTDPEYARRLPAFCPILIRPTPTSTPVTIVLGPSIIPSYPFERLLETLAMEKSPYRIKWDVFDMRTVLTRLAVTLCRVSLGMQHPGIRFDLPCPELFSQVLINAQTICMAGLRFAPTPTTPPSPEAAAEMAPSPSKTPTLSTPGSNPGMGLGRADSASSMQSDRPPRPQPMKPPTAEAAQRLRERQAELMDEKCRFLVLILIALGREASWSMGVQQASLGAAAPSLAVAEHHPWTELLPYTFQASLQLLASLNMLRSQLEEAQTIFQGVRRLFVSQSDRVVFREMQDVWGRLDEAGLMPLLQALVARVDGVDARVAAVSSPAATGSAVTGPTSAEPSERTLASHVAASADAMLLENTTPESRREFIRLADGVMDGLATLSSHREGRHGAPISPVSPMSSLASPTSHQFTGRDHVHGHGHDHGDGEDDKAGHTGRRLSRHRRQGQPAFNVHPVDGEGRAIHLVRRIKHFVLFVAGIYAMLTIVFYLVGCPYRPGAEAIPATPGKLPAMPVDTHATARAQAQAQAHAHTHGDRKWTSLREAALCPITTVQHDPLLLIVGHRAAHVRAAAVAALPPTVVASWQAYVAPPLQTTTAALQTAWQTALDPVWRTDALDRVLTAVPAAWQHAGQTAETFVVAPVFTTGSYVRFLIGRNVTPRERAAWQQWQTRLAQTLSSRVHAWRRQWAPPPYNHASGTPS